MAGTVTLEKHLGWKVAGLSAIAGMRSMTGPALLAVDNRALAKTKIGQKLFGSDKMKVAIQAAALGEFLFDKLPITPKRTNAFSLAARAASGALVGASLYSAANDSPIKGALVGSGSAVAAAIVSFHLRKFLTDKVHIPDTIVALAEDAFVVSKGLQMLDATLYNAYMNDASDFDRDHPTNGNGDSKNNKKSQNGGGNGNGKH